MYVQISNRPLRLSHFACLVFASLTIFAVGGIKSDAQCAPPPAYTARLQQLDTQVSGFQLYVERGKAYLEIKCLAEARSSFESASANADSEQGEVKENLKALARKFLDLTSSYEALNAGRIAEAKALLLKCSDEGIPPEISVQASFALAELLVQSPDDTLWPSLEPNMRRLDEAGLWQARRYRLIYGLTAQNATERIEQLTGALASDTPVQTRLEDEIILAELLRLAGRTSEAELFAKNIEFEVGHKAISPDLRVQYLRVCAGIASVEARNGDHAAQVRYQTYLSAMGNMYESP
jgi:hypothetical protein